MDEYVTDTHTLLWHFYAPARLGAGARKVLAAADDGDARIRVPALVIAESMMVAQKGRIEGLTLERLLPPSRTHGLGADVRKLLDEAHRKMSAVLTHKQRNQWKKTQQAEYRRSGLRPNQAA